jgi:hypothetical protein
MRGDEFLGRAIIAMLIPSLPRSMGQVQTFRPAVRISPPHVTILGMDFI